MRSAVYLFLLKENKIFLIRRKNTGWGDGKYVVPAGHLEPNESLTQAAVREAREEAGIEINTKSLRLVHTMHRKGDFDYVDLFFLVDKWGGEAKNAEDNMADDAQWFSIDNFPENTIEHVKAAFENYKKGIFFSEFGFYES